MSEQKKCACIILARGGSKGIPSKNLQKIGGRSLIARSVMAARTSKLVTQVFVSTDDAAIAEEARLYGAYIIDRPADLSGDTASSEAGWLHAMEAVKNALGEITVFLQCTSPFTRSEDIDALIGQMRAQSMKSSLSVVRDHGFLWGVSLQGGVGVNHNSTEPRQRRQDLSPQFRETGAIYGVDTAVFLRTKNRFIAPIGLVETVGPSVEIDSREDLALCQSLERNENVPDLGRVKALVMDFDGVHTDDRVLVSQAGEEAVLCSRSDGLGLSALRAHGFPMLIISKERNTVVSQRASKLGIDVAQAQDDKVQAFNAWLKSKPFSPERVLYVGNDVNDLPLLAHAGLSAAPKDAHPDVLRRVDWVIPKKGGQGALRHLADHLMRQMSHGQ